MLAPMSKPRWYHLTPARFVVGLLAVEIILLLSERFHWFAFNEKKGWAVLIGLAVLGVAMVLILAWFVFALLLRWRFQFSLRTLLLFVLACAAVCSWMAVKMQQARRQRDAVEALAELEGVFLWYDSEYEDCCGLGDSPLRGPAWLRGLLGNDFFNEVARGNFTFTAANDATVLHLHAFPRLRSLLLDSSQVTPACLHHIASLRCLEHLSLRSVKITDEAIIHLEPLTNLKWLFLDETQVTDDGLLHLACMNRLEGLYLGGTAITDAGLHDLKGLSRLQALGLNSTAITDAGLKSLEGLAELEWLFLWNTKVTDAGVQDLQKALPNCKIDH